MTNQSIYYTVTLNNRKGNTDLVSKDHKEVLGRLSASTFISLILLIFFNFYGGRGPSDDLASFILDTPSHIAH